MLSLWWTRLEMLVGGVAKSYRLRTLVVGFVLTYRLAHEVMGYMLADGPARWFRPLAVVLGGFAGWWLLSVLAALHPLPSVRIRCEKRPYVTGLTLLVFALALPSTLLESANAGLARLPGAVERVIYHSVFAFLVWLLLCVISEEISKAGAEPPVAYKRTVDGVFSRLPQLRAAAAGALVALSGMVVVLLVLSLALLLLGFEVRELGW
jgi:hypothetical protein